jgi:DNA invertase Pin-like site-specific DNA recombinase
MEKVIVVGVDSDEKIFVKCLSYTNDVQLEADVFDYIGDSTFYVIYEEDLDDLEDALDDMYIPVREGKKLTFEDRRTIKNMIESGDFTQKEVAGNYGVSRQTIGRICKDES